MTPETNSNDRLIAAIERAETAVDTLLRQLEHSEQKIVKFKEPAGRGRSKLHSRTY